MTESQLYVPLSSSPFETATFDINMKELAYAPPVGSKLDSLKMAMLLEGRITNPPQIANPSVASLYEDALVYETGTAITSSGALTAYSGKKTGRSPSDKRIVKEPSSENDIWYV